MVMESTEGAAESQTEVETLTREEANRIAEERVRAATSTADKRLSAAQKQLEALQTEKEDLESQLARASSTLETLKKAGSFEDAEQFAAWRADEEARLNRVRQDAGRALMEATRKSISADYGVPLESLATARTEADMWKTVAQHQAEMAAVAPPPQKTTTTETPPPPQPKQNVGGTGNPPVRSTKPGVDGLSDALMKDPGWERFISQYPG